MKKIKFIFGLLVLSNIGLAQYWNPNGTHIYNNNSGSVGIGTITPVQKLDVNGNINVRGTHLVYDSQFGVIDWGGGGIGDLIFRSLSTQGDINYLSYTDRMTLTNNGRLILGQNPCLIAPCNSDDQVYVRMNNYNGLTLEQNSTTLRSVLTLRNNNSGKSFQLGTTGSNDAAGGQKFIIRDE